MRAVFHQRAHRQQVYAGVGVLQVDGERCLAAFGGEEGAAVIEVVEPVFKSGGVFFCLNHGHEQLVGRAAASVGVEGLHEQRVQARAERCAEIGYLGQSVGHGHRHGGRAVMVPPVFHHRGLTECAYVAHGEELADRAAGAVGVEHLHEQDVGARRQGGAEVGYLGQPVGYGHRALGAAVVVPPVFDGGRLAECGQVADGEKLAYRSAHALAVYNLHEQDVRCSRQARPEIGDVGHAVNHRHGHARVAGAVPPVFHALRTCGNTPRNRNCNG